MHPPAESSVPAFDFPDLRLEKRCVTILEALTDNSTGSIPEACSTPAATKAMYRFLESDHFETETIDEGIARDTIARIPAGTTLLVAQDTTSLNFSSLSQTSGLGDIDDKHTKGMLMHSALAIGEDGLPLGVIHRKTWVRVDEEFGKRELRKTRPTKDKESFRWQETEEIVEARIPSTVRMIMVSDRESDVFDYIARHRAPHCEFLIRITQNRNLAKGSECHRLFDQLEAAPIKTRAVIPITDHKTGTTRQAKIHYRWSVVTLDPPVHGMPIHTTPVTVSVILVREEDAPSGVRPVEWKLMTSLTIATVEEALRVVEWYSRRWLIERFHYVLKSGCTIEKLQLETAERLDRAIALYTIVAWRLLYTTYVSRLQPEASAATILEPYEWQALYCFVKKIRQPPVLPPSVVEAVRMIALLGGFMGRKGDGSPGVKVLWRGIRRLTDIAETYRFFVLEDGRDVGNG